MAEKSKKPASKAKTTAPEEKIEGALNQGEHFLEKHGKKIITVLLIAIVLIGCYFGYTYLIANPRAEKASEAMFVAQQHFASGDFEAALNGDGSNPGFIEVVDDFGNTKSGRLAAHYAGICYLKAGDLDNALTYLEKYKTGKGAPAAIINAQNLGMRADIFAERGDLKKAGELYDKAIAAGNNILTTPYFLKKAGDLQARQGNVKAALDAYNRIKNEYGNSMEARDIDKYIGALEQL